MADTLQENKTTASADVNAKLPEIQNLSVNNNTTDSPSSAASARSSGQSTPLTEQSNNTPLGPASDSKTPVGPIRTPFAHPLPTCHPDVRPDLTPDQATKYQTVLTAVHAWKTMPTTTAKNAPQEPLNNSERMWLTRECLLRYLRATTWNPTHALQRLQATLIWRREFKTEQLTADYISPEMETGKECLLGYDVNARPCLHLNPGRQNTQKSERQIEGMVYMLERTVDLMPPGQETTALLISFKNSSSGGSPSVGQGRQVLTILQGHYPERLGRACIADCKCSTDGTIPSPC